MPSTVVHVALAALLAAALLGDEFDGRSLVVVAAATAAIDLDVFVGWAVLGAHRAAFHTLLLPGAVGALLLYDGRWRPASTLRRRWGGRGERLAWVTVAAVVLAGVGPDLMFNGVNLLYPLHDQFYALDGELLLSDRRGVVQTFYEVEESALGSTEEVQYRTGADPDPASAGSDAEQDPERVFPVATSGLQMLLVVSSLLVTTVRLRETRNR